MNVKEKIEAHDHSTNNLEEVKNSTLCGCFYCRSIVASEVVPKEGGSMNEVFCPICGLDSIIGDGSGYPITAAFLKEMHDFYFSVEGASNEVKSGDLMPKTVRCRECRRFLFYGWRYHLEIECPRCGVKQQFHRRFKKSVLKKSS